MKKNLVLTCILFLAIISNTYARVIPSIPNTNTLPTVPLLPIKTTSHKIITTIKNGVAVTTLETEYHNPNNRILEGTYLFALPRGASVADFSLWIDDKEMPAELLDSKKAEDLYISIVRKMIDPALLEFVGRETFKMRIFPFPANGSRKIKLSYQQVITAENNLLRYEYPLTAIGNGHEDSIASFSCDISIEAENAIKSVFSPTHEIKVNKEGNKANVSFSGSHVATDRDFVLYISNSNKQVDLSFVPFAKTAEDGYFLMMLSPKTKIDASEINAKDIVYILDTSGSMVGDKMEQAKKALQYCLHQLNEKDNFNIISFSTEATPYKDALVEASKDNVKKALSYVEENIYARGGTNLEEALQYAIEMAPKNTTRPYMVILLTDGKPTIGVTNPDDIIQKVKKGNVANLRLFSFGIGDQLNAKLLDRLVEENRGVREYVSAKEDIEIKISNFADKVAFPVLSNIKIKFPSSEELRISEVYPREIPDLFKGSSITLLGRYKGNGDQAIRVTGMIAGKEQEFVYEVSFPKENTENNHIPRLWSVRKVGFLLDQIRLHGENDELKKEVVFLAKKFGIVTPYTSYLVIEDNVQPVTTNAPRVLEEQVWGGDFDDASKNAPGDKRMKSDSGESAIETSKDIQDMKQANNAYGTKGRAEKTQEKLRQIDLKTFYLSNGVWHDNDTLAKDAEKAEKKQITYLSTEYFDLLKQYPKIGKFLAIGTEINILWEGTIFEIRK